MTNFKPHLQNDNEADMAYLTLYITNKKHSHSEFLDREERLMADYDIDGNITGIEILGTPTFNEYPELTTQDIEDLSFDLSNIDLGE